MRVKNIALSGAAATALGLAALAGTGVAFAAEEGDQTSPDTTTESAESDGPGGHEDPAGDVDHQFEGEE